MACLIKAPDGAGKGCVSFTTPERDHFIKNDIAVRAAIESLKHRYFVGLHHNWHDHDFAYDPLFDFSMAGEGDLIEREGKPFDRIALDACNFVPACFAPREGGEKFWDVLCTSRAVFFKGLPEFFRAIRTIYDSGRFIRVLHLCPVPPANPEGTHLHDIRQRFEAMFSSEERRLFNLMTMEWDNPFPLDLETLAFFYRASRVYVHAAPNERRARAGAYAWATGMPMVSRENIASILPERLRRPPFFFGYDDPAQMSDAILAAIDSKRADPEWDVVAEQFSTSTSAQRLETALQALASRRGETLSSQPIHPLGFDIRLGRHHGIGGGTNQIDQPIGEFCQLMRQLPENKIAEIAMRRDPEMEVASKLRIQDQSISAPAQNSVPHLDGFKSGLRRLLSRGR
jgi:glycosyltransferase involved in cell wall biosynthesis